MEIFIFLLLIMTKNIFLPALHERAKEIGLKINQSSSKLQENTLEEMLFKQAEVFWQEYYAQRAQNVIENKKEKNYNLTEEQQK